MSIVQSKSVVQDWVSELSWKQQSILFSSLRGPDQELLRNVKQYSKWMRSVTQHNADPSKPYMNDIKLPPIEDIYKELEHCPCHFVHHFLDGMAIIAYGHPDAVVAKRAADVHYKCAEELFHFVPEMPAVFDLRHRDKVNGKDPEAGTWKLHTDAAYGKYMEAVLKRFSNPKELNRMIELAQQACAPAQA
jgi:hypothetical protein